MDDKNQKERLEQELRFLKESFEAEVISKEEFEKFEERYLLARDMGILILSTPLGIIAHKDAKGKNTGGRLLAYCY